MKYLLSCFGILLLLSCNQSNSEPLKELALLSESERIVENEKDYTYYYDSISRDDYQIKLGVLELSNDEFELVISMKLFRESHYISPNAKRDFKGKFFVEFDDSEDLSFLADMEEIPLSVEEFDEDPFVDGYVNWVRKATRYVLKVKRNKTDDFGISGNLQFVIEPRCTLEKIPLIIVNQGGYLKFHVRGC
ncbi:MAG: hypothetical protein KJO05_02065 [Bacteroidia bacterium]|nr:hypothetical protein [Bacteroidia bacterium]NNF29952.1 hypothetical protein [Flavobacteriaceae bacterium]MBT8276068.1 hypothetical protein [Bacteroidia bacterium]NNJ81357.1 hypothetical protein [Flavobacteriaceae bacterium]NNK53657.1 hypothetical protein [Flavobacteriaceae bacterium]